MSESGGCHLFRIVFFFTTVANEILFNRCNEKENKNGISIVCVYVCTTDQLLMPLYIHFAIVLNETEYKTEICGRRRKEVGQSSFTQWCFNESYKRKIIFKLSKFSISRQLTIEQTSAAAE